MSKMPTNEERREVARKLRETSDEIRYWLDTNPYWYVMKCVYGDVEIHDDNELFYRLADLIEPEPTVDRDALLEIADDLAAIYPWDIEQAVSTMEEMAQLIREACGVNE